MGTALELSWVVGVFTPILHYICFCSRGTLYFVSLLQGLPLAFPKKQNHSLWILTLEWVLFILHRDPT